MVKKHDDSNSAPSVLPEGAVGLFGQGAVSDMAYSPSGEYLVVATSIGLWWYELSTMTPVDMWNMEQGVISTLAFSPNGEWIATGGSDGSINVWEVSSRICLARMKRWDGQKRFNHQREISRIAFSPNGQQLAASGRRDYIIDIWHPETGEHLLKLNSECSLDLIRYCSLTRPIIFSPDSQLLVGLSPEDPNNVTAAEGDIVSVWDISTGLRIITFSEFSGFGQNFCFSRCGSFFAVGRESRALKVWTVKNWKTCNQVRARQNIRMIPSYSSDNVLRIAEVSDTSVVLRDADSCQILWTYQPKDEISHIQFFGGTHLAINSGLELKNWTLKNSQPQTSSHTHLDFVESLYFSPDSKRLAAGYRNDGVLLWNTHTPSHPQNVFKISGRKHQVFGFSNGEVHTTCVDSNIVKVLDVETQTLVAQIKPEKPPTHWAFAFSPAAQLLAAGDAEGTLRVWDATRGNLCHTFTTQTTPIVRLTFSSNGKFLASEASEGPNTQLWDVESGKKNSRVSRDAY